MLQNGIFELQRATMALGRHRAGSARERGPSLERGNGAALHASTGGAPLLLMSAGPSSHLFVAGVPRARKRGGG